MGAAREAEVLVPPEAELPGGGAVLLLRAVPRDRLDRLVHAAVTGPGEQPDVDAIRLHAAAAGPGLSVPAARRVLDEWPAPDVDEVLEHLADLVPVDPVWRAWWRLDADPALRVEMQVCAAYGMPHSFLLGARRARWTVEDRELALAWQMRLNATCPGCGTRPDEWEGRAADDPPYIVDHRAPDKGCQEKRLGDAQLTERDREQGIYTVLVPAAEYARQEAEEQARAEARERRKARRDRGAA